MLALLTVSLTLAVPVPGEVAREFSYGADPFRAGWHRGTDFRAAPGARVRAACSGRVVWAGHDVVTLRCGRWRVTHLPLASIAVERGARVRAGTPVGTVARSREHAGLHLGVRRAGDRSGYVDPVPLLGAAPRGVPAAPRAERRPPRPVTRVGPPRAARPPRAAPQPRAAPRVAPPPGATPRLAPRVAPPPGAAPRPAPPPGAAPRAAPLRPVPRSAPPVASRPAPPRPLPAGPGPAAVRVLAPWPAWLGLAVLLAGAVGGGVRIGLRRRRAPLAAVGRR